MSKVTIGNTTVAPEDIVSIAAHGAPVELDLAIIEKAPEGGKTIEIATCEVTTKSLPAIEARAVLAAFLVALSQEKTLARKSVLQFIAEKLNSSDEIPLHFGCAAECLISLLAAGPGVTDAEASAIRRSTAPAAAVLALVSEATTAIAVVADAIAALSVEACQAPLRPYDSAWFDTARPHPAAVLSATTVRVLLSNSKRVAPDTKKKAGAEPEAFDVPGFRDAPELHGVARAAGGASRRAARVELNALPKAATHVAPTCATAYAALAQCASGVASLASASAARVQVAAGAGAAQDTTGAPAVPSSTASVQDALELGVSTLRAVDALVDTLGAEFSAGEALLLAAEQAAQGKAAERAARTAAREAEQAAKAAAAQEKRQAELDAMTPEQREKAEAADAAREAKAAAKAAKKNKKASGGAADGAGSGTPGDTGLLNLGDGTRKVLALLRHAASLQSEGGAAAAAADATAPGVPVVPPPVPVALLQSMLHPLSKPLGVQEGQHLKAFVVALAESIASGGGARRPKTAKGTRDFGPDQMAVREQAFNIIRGVFKRHGASELDTPVFELRETLMGKYGEEGGKLIYDLANQGGELLSMRYDLTVPFARYCAQHGVSSLKRFHISKVYRRDNVSIERGRYREFYQCDYDVAGTYGEMLPDAEVLSVACDILSSLPIGSFKLKFNHRGLLDGMLELAGVPAAKFRTICSSIDKLDKEPWEAVKAEMVGEKGLAEEAADRIGALVQVHGEPRAVLAQLTAADSQFMGHATSKAALESCAKLFDYLDAMGALQYISFDLSLARGLDYYTGVIYEAVLTDPTVAVGSIAAGGRYDNLVGMFSPSGTQVPCVGVSIGIERVFTIMEARAKAQGKFKKPGVSVLVASVGKGMTVARLEVCSALWNAGLSAETLYSENPKMGVQFDKAFEQDIPFMVVLGEDEVARGTVKVKNLATKEEVEQPRGEMVQQLLKWGAVKTGAMPSPAATSAGAGAAEPAEAPVAPQE